MVARSESVGYTYRGDARLLGRGDLSRPVVQAR